MPKRIIDYEALWTSNKLRRCTPKARVDYVWMYGLADADGNFEVGNLRAIWSRVCAIRPELTMKRLKNCIDQYVENGLLFTWHSNRTTFGHWVGSNKPGRLPEKSKRYRLYRV